MRSRSKFNEEYFPYTNICPIDGKHCVQSEACKFWNASLDKNICWYVEFHVMIEEIFNTEDTYIHFRDQKGNLVEGLRHIDFHLKFDDKFDSKPIEVEVRISLNSYRLANKIMQKFDLSEWTVESTNYDGGDDTDLRNSYPALLNDKIKLEKKFLEFRDQLIPQIIKSEPLLNTCDICKKKMLYLTEYSEKAICRFCENKIITDNISRYC